MKEYTDAGLEVWLRFAHEVKYVALSPPLLLLPPSAVLTLSLPPGSYYQQDGTYQGDVNDFKEGWDVVAKACRSIAPEVKMWYTPNVASLDECTSRLPPSPSRDLRSD